MPAIACEALADGFDSPSLTALAGEIEPVMSSIGPLFEAALRELGIPVPTKREAAIRIARSVAVRIVSGELAPYEGARRIWQQVELPLQEAGEVNVFLDLASEYPDDESGQSEYDTAIIEESRKLVGE